MSTPETRLRDEWRERTAGRAPSRDCFEPEQIWRAVALESSAQDRRSLIEHVAVCADCAEAWRLASELLERAPSQAGAVPRHRASRWRTLALAAASFAVVAVAGAGWLTLRRSLDQAAWRAPAASVRSLLEEDRTLPRDRFLLRWTEGPPGTIYDVEVATTNLRLVARGVALTAPEYLVPEQALVDLAPGTRLAWRVEATLPDGRVVSSVTHVNGVP